MTCWSCTRVRSGRSRSGRRMAFELDNTRHLGGLNHFHLLNHPRVYEVMLEWLRKAPEPVSQPRYPHRSFYLYKLRRDGCRRRSLPAPPAPGRARAPDPGRGPCALRARRLRQRDDGRRRGRGGRDQAAAVRLLGQQGAHLPGLPGAATPSACCRPSATPWARPRTPPTPPRSACAHSSTSCPRRAAPSACCSTRRCHPAARSPSACTSTASGSWRWWPPRCWPNFRPRAREKARVEVEALSTAVMGAAEALARWWLRTGEQIPAADAAELLIATVVPGLRARTASLEPGEPDERRPQGRRPRRQPHPVRAVEQRVRQRLQPGHAQRRAGRPDRPLFARGRAPGRGGRRRRAQAQPRLQPHARDRAGQPPVARDARLRHRPGLRHGSRRPRSPSPTRSRSARSTPASPAARTPRPTRRSR